MPNGTGGMPGYGDAPTDGGESWIEVGWGYVEGAIDTIGDVTNILEDWGIIGGNGETPSTQQQQQSEFESTANDWISNAQSWAEDFVGGAASSRMLPWILGGLAVITIVILTKR